VTRDDAGRQRGRDASAEEPDADADARSEALRFIGRRLAIWAAPLTLVGALLIGLGIPWWISVLAMLAVLAVVVFEIDI